MTTTTTAKNPEFFIYRGRQTELIVQANKHYYALVNLDGAVMLKNDTYEGLRDAANLILDNLAEDYRNAKAGLLDREEIAAYADRVIGKGSTLAGLLRKAAAADAATA